VKKGRVIGVADVKVAAGNGRPLRLGVAAKAKIGITFDEHFLVDRAVRAVADDATFPQRIVLEDKWPSLVSMALGATLIPPRHGQAAGGFHDVRAVRVVALDAVHAAFNDRVMLGQVELSLHIQVALKTSRRVVARINNEFFRAAQARRGDMFAAGAVTGFAPALTGHRRRLGMNPRVRAGGKSSHNFRMTIHARLVADKMRARNFQGRHDFGSGRGTGNEQKRA
jgi:hypothetical protein